MKAKLHHPLVVLAIAGLMLVAIVLIVGASNKNTDAISRTDTTTQTEEPQELPDPEPMPEEPTPPAEEPAPPTTEKVVLDCSDCWLAPVDKNHSLPSTYAPQVEATGLDGGGSLTPVAAAALRDLFSAATADGMSMYVRSAYRSYQTQEATFEKWVNVEIDNGATREEAEEIANTYSARPGESEHQLGTTTDLLCTGAGFDSTPCNEKVWKWLDENAADFGFVMSYPEGKDDITGYTHEPWHYRYIGIDNAKDFKAQSAQTLNQWLLSRY